MHIQCNRTDHVPHTPCGPGHWPGPDSDRGLQDQNDHPLVSRYAGSTVDSRKHEAFGEYTLVVGLDQAGKHQIRPIKGKLTRFVYQNPAGRSTLEIFRNYEQALKAAGADVLYQCEMDQCGPAYARSAWNRVNGLFAASDGDPRYLAASVKSAEGTAYVAVMVGRRRSQLDILEIAGMETGMVAVDAAALANGLDRDGRVSVEGIFFDVDQAIVKPASKPALEQVAQLLGSRPDLRLFVVGHTDNTGDFAHNRQLSEARARAVVAMLVNEYRIPASRLEGYGVGPLAPAATNATDTGRRQNRRVELVQR